MRKETEEGSVIVGNSNYGKQQIPKTLRLYPDRYRSHSLGLQLYAPKSSSRDRPQNSWSAHEEECHYSQSTPLGS